MQVFIVGVNRGRNPGLEQLLKQMVGLFYIVFSALLGLPVSSVQVEH